MDFRSLGVGRCDVAIYLDPEAETMTIEHDNLLAAESGGRVYRSVPRLTLAEWEARQREQEIDALRLRLEKVERERTARLDAKHRYRDAR